MRRCALEELLKKRIGKVDYFGQQKSNHAVDRPSLLSPSAAVIVCLHASLLKFYRMNFFLSGEKTRNSQIHLSFLMAWEQRSYRGGRVLAFQTLPVKRD